MFRMVNGALVLNLGGKTSANFQSYCQKTLAQIYPTAEGSESGYIVDGYLEQPPELQESL